MEAIKNGTELERNPDGTVKSGVLNPNGRPKGKTMKEFARDYYMLKSDEEKRAYIEWLDDKKPGFAWTMGEGNPSSDDKMTLVVPNIGIAEDIANKYAITPSSTTTDSQE